MTKVLTQIKGELTQDVDKGNVRVKITLTEEQREQFLLDKGEQPTGMITVEVC